MENINWIIVVIISIFVGVMSNLLTPRVLDIFKRSYKHINVERKYLEHIKRRVKFIGGFQLPFPVNVENIFVPPNFEIRNKFETKTVEFSKLFDLDNNLLIFGEPGSGKTTLLAYLAAAFASNRQKELWGVNKNYFPIFISLSRWQDTPGNFKNLLISEVLSTVQIYSHQKILAEKVFERKLRLGECILLIDGLDEISGNKTATLSEIEKFSIEYPENKIIVASRYLKNKRESIPASFLQINLLGFTSQQIADFAYSWSLSIHKSSEPKTDEITTSSYPQRLLHIINSNQQIKSLSSNPLLLYLIFITYYFRAEIPDHRAELFSVITQTMLDQWDKVRNIKTSQYSIFSKELLLELIAEYLHSRQSTIIQYNEIKYVFQDNFEQMEVKPNELEQIVREICDRSNLLVEKEPKTYQFAHFSFQEYYAAKALTRQDTDKAAKTLHKYWHESKDWWKEISLFYCQLTPDATPFFREILSSKNHHQNFDDIILASECMASSSVETSTRKRIVELFARNYLQETDDKSVRLLVTFSKTYDEELTGYLLDALKNTDAEVRGRAIFALSYMKIDSLKLRNSLIDLLKDKEEFFYLGEEHSVNELALSYLNLVSKKDLTNKNLVGKQNGN